jgi:hypothetical protein
MSRAYSVWRTIKLTPATRSTVDEQKQFCDRAGTAIHDASIATVPLMSVSTTRPG